MNLPTKKDERQVLAHAIAQRTVNMVPNDLLCREFGIDLHQLGLVRKWAPYTRAVESLQRSGDELALASMYLDAEEIKQEARISFETMTDIRDANRNSTDAAEQRVALEICKWILETSGHSKVNKSLNVDAKLNIPAEYAGAILQELQDSAGSGPSLIAPVTVELIEEMPDDIPIDSAITHKGMEAMYDAQHRSGHDGENPYPADSKAGKDPVLPEAG